MLNIEVVGADVANVEETNESNKKYFNINVSEEEVERKPDIVRLYASPDKCLEYKLVDKSVIDKLNNWIDEDLSKDDPGWSSFATGMHTALGELGFIDGYVPKH